jgi:hypothetical protein
LLVLGSLESSRCSKAEQFSRQQQLQSTVEDQAAASVLPLPEKDELEPQHKTQATSTCQLLEVSPVYQM